MSSSKKSAATPGSTVLRSSRSALLILALVTVGSVATFWPVRQATFLQDDHPIVRINPVVREGGLGTIFGTDWWGGVGGSDASLYRPVTILSFALQRSDGEVPAEPAHWANVALHALAAALLAIYARRIGAGRIGAGLAGGLFLVHPVHVSVVAGLVGRAEILSLLFGLGALLSQSVASPASGRALRRAAPWCTALCLFLALGSKESAIAFPVLLILQEWLLNRPQPGAGLRDWRNRFLALVPAGVATLAYLGLRAAVLGSAWAAQQVRLSENPLVRAEGWERVMTTFAVAGRYARLLWFPSVLSPDYSGNVVGLERSLLAPYPLAGVVSLLGVVAVLIFGWRRWRSRPPGSAPDRALAATLGAALLLLPYLVIGQILVLVGVVLAERLIYVPSAGFCVLIGVAVSAGCARSSRPIRAGVVVALSAVLVVAAVKTHLEARHWQTRETLFEAAVRATPNSPRAQFTLGMIRLEQGREDEALARFEETVRLWPQFSSAWYETGMILARRGDLVGARDALGRSVEIQPGRASAQVNLGIVLHRLGDLEASEQQLRATLERFPASATAAAELGHVLLESSRPGEAAAWYRRAVDLGRRDLEPRRREAELRARTTGASIPRLDGAP